MTTERKDLLDRTFEIGIILKGIDGVLETIGGLLLIFVSSSTINAWAERFTRADLSRDPHDWLANNILKTAHGLTGSAIIFGAIYLLSHGLVKIVLVAALLKNKLWAYPWMIGFLVLFVVYQLYRMVIRLTIGMTLLTIFDIAIIWLTWREYQKQRGKWQDEPTIVV